jgi:type IV pilus assembly protein PilW
MLMTIKQQQGMSLVEMLVSLVAGLVVVAGGISLFTSVIVSGNTTLMLSRLNQDVQAVTDIIARDIQRAGYDPNAVALVGNSPPSASAYTFSTEKDLWPASPATATCIRVKYWDPEPASGRQRLYSYMATPRPATARVKYTPLYEPDCAALTIVTAPAATSWCRAPKS